MTVVISIENLGKSYMIGHKDANQKYTVLRDVIADGMRKLWSRLRHPEYYTHENIEEFWALKDFNLEVKQGERLGIIGKNGAGKTTLLKLLSRITEPTTGKLKINGRVASLLEVGTGFHPELTGRENIFLNGSILGMTRQDVRRKFDEIVDFAGVELFLDTPVKRYSSGMYVRLGFSIAAHLEPEILVVDEVLAVGDVSFQKKCIGKMSSASKEGRTILFVSHQMHAVSNLCDKAILLDKGKVEMEGEVGKVIDSYLNEKKTNISVSLKDRKDRQGNGKLRLLETWIEDEKGNRLTNVIMGKTIKICARYEIIQDNLINGLLFSFAINTLGDIKIANLYNVTTDEIFNDNIPSKGIVTCVVHRLPLNNGIYSYNIMAMEKNEDILDYICDAGELNVAAGDYFGTGKIPSNDRLIMIDHSWNISPN